MAASGGWVHASLHARWTPPNVNSDDGSGAAEDRASFAQLKNARATSYSNSATADKGVEVIASAWCLSWCRLSYLNFAAASFLLTFHVILFV